MPVLTLESCIDLAEGVESVARKMTIDAQALVVSELVRRAGGVRKAAVACGQSPSNFVGLKTGKRIASLKILRKIAKAADSLPEPAPCT